MPRSSAGFIAYDIRPAKQSERRILMEILRIGGECGLPISTYRYVGMGANRFYDFLLFYKYTGVRRMISLEHDKKMFKRSVFNVPYGFIDVRDTNATKFISEDSCNDPTIYWLDYDGGICPEMIGDIVSLGTKIQVGDFIFATVYGGPPRILDKANVHSRLSWLQDTLGPMASDVSVGDVENSDFPTAVHKVLVSTVKNAFATRRDGRFKLLIQVLYSDSKSMVTVGGALLRDDQSEKYDLAIRETLPFLDNVSSSMYEIRSFNLTDLERALFDRAATADSRTRKHKNALKKLGFKDDDIFCYRELMRYIPRYYETII